MVSPEPERVEQAIRAIDPLQVPGHLLAQKPTREAMIGVAPKLDRHAILDCHQHAAGIGAVERADAFDQGQRGIAYRCRHGDSLPSDGTDRQFSVADHCKRSVSSFDAVYFVQDGGLQSASRRKFANNSLGGTADRCMLGREIECQPRPSEHHGPWRPSLPQRAIPTPIVEIAGLQPRGCPSIPVVSIPCRTIPIGSRHTRSFSGPCPRRPP